MHGSSQGISGNCIVSNYYKVHCLLVLKKKNWPGLCRHSAPRLSFRNLSVRSVGWCLLDSIRVLNWIEIKEGIIATPHLTDKVLL